HHWFAKREDHRASKRQELRRPGRHQYPNSLHELGSRGAGTGAKLRCFRALTPSDQTAFHRQATDRVSGTKADYWGISENKKPGFPGFSLSAPASGAGGRVFESRYSDQSTPASQDVGVF